jgi:hypothetical protein
MSSLSHTLLAAAILLSLCALSTAQEARDDSSKRSTDWFRDARWGVFVHAFDVEALAEQLQSVRAGFLFITIGQNSGHYCAPNETYDQLVGITPSKCSRRDLIADLYGALKQRDIPLLVYLPSGAPAADPIAVERLGWEWGFEGGWPRGWGGKRTGKRLAEFQLKWEAIIREWSQRWGENVRGWWFDGCYFADEMYRHPDAPNFESFAAAARAGNPDSLIAFNPGVKYPIISMTKHEDYTAGEINEPDKAQCDGRWVEYTRKLLACEGVVAWDVPPGPDGAIPADFLAQLKALSEGL